ncbi:9611_t:CDS:2, partial [Funneliformis caledonium]
MSAHVSSVSRTINGGAFNLKRSDQGEQFKRDPHTKRDAKIDNYFQYEQVQLPHTPPHCIFLCEASSGASEGSKTDKGRESEAGLERPCISENKELSKRSRENKEQEWRPPNFIPSDDENNEFSDYDDDKILDNDIILKDKKKLTAIEKATLKYGHEKILKIPELDQEVNKFITRIEE